MEVGKANRPGTLSLEAALPTLAGTDPGVSLQVFGSQWTTAGSDGHCQEAEGAASSALRIAVSSVGLLAKAAYVQHQ